MTEENITTSQTEKDDQGRVSVWTEETRDPDGILISKRVDSYNYYETGEVDTIILRVYNEADELVSAKVVKHGKE